MHAETHIKNILRREEFKIHFKDLLIVNFNFWIFFRY